MNKLNLLPTTIILLLLTALVTASDGAVSGAYNAMITCAQVIIPCLFPFFVVSDLISAMGLPVYLGYALQKPMSLLFGVSGIGAGVFILGILGGYPLGASVIANLLRRGELSPTEGRKLLAFCNNSGPAFLIGAAGIGVFHSAAAGLLLYTVHILSAVITGLFLSGTRLPDTPTAAPLVTAVGLSSVLPDAIGKSALQIVQICGYVIFFGAVAGIMETLGFFSVLYSSLACCTPLPLQLCKALCIGLLELGCGIGAMAGCATTPQALALCSFLAGCGGLSVAMQTAGVLQGSGISLRSHLLGRLCCGGISAFIMYTLASILL